MRHSDSGLSKQVLTASLLFSSMVFLPACATKEVPKPEAMVTDASARESEDVSSAKAPQPVAEFSLAKILAAQTKEVRERYAARHPRETIEFFKLEPGMTVVEALPEGGWYTRILYPYLGAAGTFIRALHNLSSFEAVGAI